jgi:hypothetical protein
MVQPPLNQISPDKVGGTEKEIVKMTTIDQQEGKTENLTNTDKPLSLLKRQQPVTTAPAV